MNDRALRHLLSLYVFGAFSAETFAQDGRFAVSAKFANIGPGVDATYGWSRDLHTRVTVHYAPTEELTRNDDIKAAGSLLLDWHPGGRSFRLSGGLSVLRERLGRSATGSGVFIASRESTELTRYLGIGWGNALDARSRWNFTLDLGAFGGGGGFSFTSTSEQGERIRLQTPEWRLVVATGVSYRF
jgi:hypothetical protein